jgi:hypothetical protein
MWWDEILGQVRWEAGILYGENSVAYVDFAGVSRSQTTPQILAIIILPQTRKEWAWSLARGSARPTTSEDAKGACKVGLTRKHKCTSLANGMSRSHKGCNQNLRVITSVARVPARRSCKYTSPGCSSHQLSRRQLPERQEGTRPAVQASRLRGAMRGFWSEPNQTCTVEALLPAMLDG